MRLQIGIWSMIIGLVFERVTCFKYKVLGVLVLHMYKCVVIKVDGMSTEENSLIVYRGSVL